ncbi:TPA: hypothetical protein N0F65_003363 [Lagenidium giganteum]|uniref:Uncharacterized protein n=1 Tax=Lagenidium giganteum TaxID=4803 RepID=A0AAV2Z6Z0_9STRA|nr:TPA: hypothetical protein N0F65_003363 [Lagenidium giganteum]
MQRTPIERPITPPVRFTLRGLSNEECRAQFRFVRADIQSMIHLLRLPAIIITRGRTRAHVEEAMCVPLERLAFPCQH